MLELQTLGRMSRHQGHPVGIIPVLSVGIGKEGNIFQIVPQGHHRSIFPIFLGFSANFIHIDGNGIEQFLHIGLAALSLNRSVSGQHSLVSAFVGKLESYFLGIALCRMHSEAVYHFAECAYPCNGCRAQAEALEIIQPSRLEEAGLVGPGSLVKGIQGGIPYSARRLVDHPSEALLIKRIDHELEVGHHILDLRPFIERIA